MKLTKLTLALGVAVAGFSAQTLAEESSPISMNIGVTSNYIWRGMTQTNNDAAVSGGLDYASDMGVYAGVWASNVQVGNAGYEFDIYGGYAGEAGDFGYDAGVILYKYDGDANADFTELYLNGSWSFLSAGLAYTVSADNAASEGDIYYNIGVSFDVMEDLSVGATYGIYDYDAGGNMNHYQLDVTKSGEFGDVTLTLSDTDLNTLADKDMKFLVSWGTSF